MGGLDDYIQERDITFIKEVAVRIEFPELIGREIGDSPTSLGDPF